MNKIYPTLHALEIFVAAVSGDNADVDTIKSAAITFNKADKNRGYHLYSIAGHIVLSTVLTEIAWSNHLHILSKTKTIEEKEYYLQLAGKHHYSAREFARLIDSATYERTLLATGKLSTLLTEFPVDTKGVFKDSYVFEFLGISRERKFRKYVDVFLKVSNLPPLNSELCICPHIPINSKVLRFRIH